MIGNIFVYIVPVKCDLLKVGDQMRLRQIYDECDEYFQKLAGGKKFWPSNTSSSHAGKGISRKSYQSANSTFLRAACKIIKEEERYA